MKKRRRLECRIAVTGQQRIERLRIIERLLRWLADEVRGIIESLDKG